MLGDLGSALKAAANPSLKILPKFVFVFRLITGVHFHLKFRINRNYYIVKIILMQVPFC
jgi:hypothetical protein